MLDKVNLLIDTLNQIRISNETVIAKLQEIKLDLTVHRSKMQTDSTAAEPREVQNASEVHTKRNPKSSPDTRNRNTGINIPIARVDSRGHTIEVGNTVHVLNAGLFKGNTGIVAKLVKVRVSIRLQSGRSTNRKSSNLEVITIDVYRRYERNTEPTGRRSNSRSEQ